MSTSEPPATPRAQAAELFARYSEELLGFFRASLPISKVDAKDLLQQTFVELLQWLTTDHERTITAPRGLLYTIARRRIRAHRDRQRRNPAAPDGSEPTDELGASPQAHEDDLEYLASLHADRRGLLRAMRRLGSTDPGCPVSDLQLVVYLRFWVGMTETEVGEVLEHPRGTIAGQLRRARDELSRRLAELEAREPGTTRTSTTLLHRWWKQLEARVDELSPTDPTRAAADPPLMSHEAPVVAEVAPEPVDSTPSKSSSTP